MLCPLCQETLLITDRNGVEIDYCAKCRGVWLDRGELQKLIDMSLAQKSTESHQAAYVPPPRADHSMPTYSDDYRGRPEDRYADRYSDRRHDSQYGYGKPKKRESWFSELFDFD